MSVMTTTPMYLTTAYAVDVDPNDQAGAISQV